MTMAVCLADGCDTAGAIGCSSAHTLLLRPVAWRVCARGLKAAHAMITDDALEVPRRARYAGWETDAARAMLAEGATLDGIAADAEARAISPQPISGAQEKLENIVNRYV